ncbi:MAG TPA: SRPBCC family protein [Thermoanaerobaculia bacterium]|nr:SRPBCC family protein [Thermoanaerobaculia bacterium]
MSIKSTFSNWGSIAGITAGALYGLVVRVLLYLDSGTKSDAGGGLFMVMTFGFLFLVPVTVGYLAVLPAPQPSRLYQLFFPWIPCALILLVAALIGWEGSICLYMGSPILFIMGSVGGLLGGRAALRSWTSMAAVLLVPWIVMPLDSKLPLPREIREVKTETVIAAPAEVVWRNIVQVPEIRPEEHRPALFTAMGFPRPVSATLDREGVGGLRHARFEKGVLFLETVTEWEKERRLAFTIDAQTESIPATTLDPHVTIGGPFFDVLTGTYTIEPLPGGKLRLHLASRHRVSTRFNVYSGLWADAIMRSIQNNILDVIRRRCETEA